MDSGGSGTDRKRNNGKDIYAGTEDEGRLSNRRIHYFTCGNKLSFFN